MKILFVFTSLIFSTQLFAQSISNDNWCGTSHRHNASLENPAILESMQSDALIRLEELNTTQNLPKGTIFKIPVVFHVLHNDGPENVSEAQIHNALDVINRDFPSTHS